MESQVEANSVILQMAKKRHCIHDRSEREIQDLGVGSCFLHSFHLINSCWVMPPKYTHSKSTLVGGRWGDKGEPETNLSSGLGSGGKAKLWNHAYLSAVKGMKSHERSEEEEFFQLGQCERCHLSWFSKTWDVII